ncbi:SAM-dependent methyltransferase [Amycolatopsis sp., V23-08]|uniref:SAM-dependent methyltransferase n=1 Tax=Amycolatopsis heterodermiae TaxID=3110235 RepID=A0ABU5QZZ0_9PSEU|nr:SAM-dependent methyltransferase [Amycolatopsis sp., V23-08]MEA5359497.1 SAM-dependent methyltransferase [Amycolatopsis sp., V23-08]
MPDAATRTERVPVGVDPNRASIARVYDAFLLGKDNYEIDREVLKQVRQAAPEAQDLAFENRGFLIRVCRFLAGQTGITQILDLGSGLPTAENTHQVVQRINPETRVVYVDNDPVVLAHGRALLEENEHTHFVAEDIFEPERILENEVVREHIDFTQPLILLQMGTLHHFNGDRKRPAEIMRQYVDALPSGSFVGLSHFFDPQNEDSDTARRMEDFFVHSPMGSGTFRTQTEIEELFPGLEMVDPGVTLCADWWPDGPRLKELNVAQRTIAGGVGRKP